MRLLIDSLELVCVTDFDSAVYDQLLVLDGLELGRADGHPDLLGADVELL